MTWANYTELRCCPLPALRYTLFANCEETDRRTRAAMARQAALPFR